MTAPTASPAPPHAGARRRGTTWIATAARRRYEQVILGGLGARWENAITVAGFAAVVAVGVVDVSSDTEFSHVFLYLLPVVAVTILASSRRGLMLAAFGCATWIAAEALEPDAVRVGNFVGTQVPRFLAFIVIVALLVTLREALADAHAADLRSRAFLSDAAHQLRTPIASLQACAETLLMSGMSDDQDHLLLLLATEAQRIGRLTNGLLQIARLDQGDASTPRPTDLGAVCAIEVDLIRHRSAPDVDIVLAVDLLPDGPVTIDPEATREALANVLDNARRHASHRIEIAVQRRGGMVTISVTDDGPGLPPGTEERAFQRFASLDGHGGSGLGLPIARGYIERQGGSLGYDEGRFVIRLPV